MWIMQFGCKVATKTQGAICVKTDRAPKRRCFATFRPTRTRRFDAKQTKSMEQVKKLVARNGAHVVDNLDELVKFLNGEN